MAKLINETQVRAEILRRADNGPNEARKRIWADCSEEPKLYTQISPDVIAEIDTRLRIIIKEIVGRNSAGSRGQTIL